MPTLTWSPELALDHAAMDKTHQEFVDLRSATEHALAVSHEQALA